MADHENAPPVYIVTKYTLDLLHKFLMFDCKPCKTSCSPNAYLVANESPPLPDSTLYRSMVAKRILRYLQWSIHQGLTFTPGPLTLSANSDADWARDSMDRKSIYEILVFLSNSPVTSSAKKQPTVSHYSNEAKYRALTSSVAKL
ncbi:uncharacterized mitochondrial protein AtMg00810-like [Quercus suber]|uniref:uncharacterized mitochondrial protein AtMg00810-like n=1 Tax=Quercus suber TaxID=58331 RepID=UPI0032DF8C19